MTGGRGRLWRLEGRRRQSLRHGERRCEENKAWIRSHDGYEDGGQGTKICLFSRAKRDTLYVIVWRWVDGLGRECSHVIMYAYHSSAMNTVLLDQRRASSLMSPLP